MPLWRPPLRTLAPGFEARLSADQTGLANVTYTKVLFDTAVRNVGGFFDTSNNKWTPPPGLAMLSLVLNLGSGISGSTLNFAAVYMNGAAVQQSGKLSVVNAVSPGPATWIGEVNGTDYFEAYVFGQTGSTYRVLASASVTQFFGTMLNH